MFGPSYPCESCRRGRSCHEVCLSAASSRLVRLLDRRETSGRSKDSCFGSVVADSLYVRAGAIVPLGPSTRVRRGDPGLPQSSFAFIPEQMEASLYIAIRATGYGYEKGECAVIPIPMERCLPYSSLCGTSRHISRNDSRQNFSDRRCRPRAWNWLRSRQALQRSALHWRTDNDHASLANPPINNNYLSFNSIN